MIIVFSNFSGVLQTGSKVIAWSLCLARVHLQMKQCQHTKWLKKIFSTRWKKEIEWSPPPASRAFSYGTFPCNKRQSKKRWKRLCSQGGSPQNAKLLELTHQGGYELRCDLPPKMNVHREDRKLERILVAVRKGFYAHYFSVVLVLRQFFDASGCLMKQNEQKKIWLTQTTFTLKISPKFLFSNLSHESSSDVYKCLCYTKYQNFNVYTFYFLVFLNFNLLYLSYYY